MISEGERAPAFELPAVVGGETESVALQDFLGREVVILAFYPGDFNPACDGETTDLDELDLFTMQKDVSVLAISGDSVHSHRAFADEYDLKIPLLADSHGDVARDYGVAVDEPSAGYLNHRAVVVIGPEGEVQYAWSTEDLRELPPVDRIRKAVDDVGGAETAVARYRVGHAHYVEGRRAFTSAMGNFQDNEWMMAESDFKRAYEEFDEAAAHFNTAARFAEDDHDVGYFELAEDKAELLWQAAEWLADSASAYASGEGAEGQAMRGDAEGTLEEARRFPDPPQPDDFPPEAPPPEPEEPAEGDEESFLPDDEAEVDTSLDLVEDEVHADEDLRESVEEGDADDGAADGDDAADDEDAEDEIDDAELEEITAELEEQTEKAEAERTAELEAAADAADETAPEEAAATTPADEGSASEESADVSPPADSDAAGEAAATDADGDGDDAVELELTDPTGGEGLEPLEDEDEEEGEDAESAEGSEDIGEGDHGVPDSL